MKTSTKYIGIAMVSGLLVGCGSMRPPSTNPYFAGYHARNADEVQQEYQQWEMKQARLEKQAQIEDSLRQQFYSSSRRYRNFYDYNFSYGSPFYRYPYSWYPSSWHHYRPYRYGNYFSFRFSTSPWFVNPWWSDDYLWDSYFWGSGYYPYSYSGYPGAYPSYAYTDWYFWPSYGSGSDYYVVPSDEPQLQRPRNRDQFSLTPRPRTPAPQATISRGANSETTGTEPSGEAENNGQFQRPRSRITPAVVDREQLRQLMTRIERMKEQQEEQNAASRGSRYTGHSSDDDDSGTSARSTRSSGRSSSPASYGTRSSGGGSSSSGTASRGSSSSSSSGSGSQTARPRNRRR